MSRFLAALGPLLGRALLSVIFAYSGYQKLFVAHGRTVSAIAGRGLPFATAGAYGAGVFEVAAGVLIVLGLRTRFTALASLAYVVVVTWLFHWRPASHGDPAQMIHLLKNAGLAGGLLLLASHGPGPASIDRG